ncbi:MAG: M20/M25/M40 family metallo-hydrolase [Clostridia bacterium]|nr:M20/M25/M40 family metallo-hydrolase [Clostridia bacterium]
MGKFDKVMQEKDRMAEYMIHEITTICKYLPKRAPGSEGEKKAAEYMRDALEKECGCKKTAIEPFKVTPDSFYGWIYITVSCALVQIIMYFFYPLVGAIVMALGLIVMVLQFGLYIKAIDFFFVQKTSHNLTGIRPASGEVKCRVLFNGHIDAAWNFPVNEKWGGVAYTIHVIASIVGVLYMFVLSIIRTVQTDAAWNILTPSSQPAMFWLGVGTVLFLPLLIGLYWMWDEKVVVDGANDNLTGCYMGIAILKAMEEAGVQLEHTEVGVVLSGSEEAGLRGIKSWCAQHKGEYDDVPTYIYSFDTLHDERFLMVNYRDLNGTVETDKETGDRFMKSAAELGIPCQRGIVPPFGGATDSAAFAQAGYKVAGITALNHVLEDYYHTIHDTYTNLNPKCLADCYSVTVNCLRHIDEELGDGVNEEPISA